MKSLLDFQFFLLVEPGLHFDADIAGAHLEVTINAELVGSVGLNLEIDADGIPPAVGRGRQIHLEIPRKLFARRKPDDRFPRFDDPTLGRDDDRFSGDRPGKSIFHGEAIGQRLPENVRQALIFELQTHAPLGDRLADAGDERRLADRL